RKRASFDKSSQMESLHLVIEIRTVFTKVRGRSTAFRDSDQTETEPMHIPRAHAHNLDNAKRLDIFAARTFGFPASNGATNAAFRFQLAKRTRKKWCWKCLLRQKQSRQLQCH